MQAKSILQNYFVYTNIIASYSFNSSFFPSLLLLPLLTSQLCRPLLPTVLPLLPLLPSLSPPPTFHSSPLPTPPTSPLPYLPSASQPRL